MNWGLVALGIGGLLAVIRSEQNQVLSAVSMVPPYRVSGPGVSIVIPTLSEEKYLPFLLTSIRNQTYNPIEIIIADSSPPDSKSLTQTIASRFGARVVDAPPGNVSMARNIGAKSAQHSILLFSDADNVLSHSYTEKLVKELTKGYILAHGREVIYDSLPWAIPGFLGMYAFKSPYHTSRSVALTTDAYWSVGGYNEKLNPLEGFREDLALGEAIKRRYGPKSISLTSALLGTSCRRWRKEGLLNRTLWSGGAIRGYRGHLLQDVSYRSRMNS